MSIVYICHVTRSLSSAPSPCSSIDPLQHSIIIILKVSSCSNLRIMSLSWFRLEYRCKTPTHGARPKHCWVVRGDQGRSNTCGYPSFGYPPFGYPAFGYPAFGRKHMCIRPKITPRLSQHTDQPFLVWKVYEEAGEQAR